MTDLSQFHNLRQLVAAYQSASQSGDVVLQHYLEDNFKSWLSTHYLFNFYVDLIFLTFDKTFALRPIANQILTDMYNRGEVRIGNIISTERHKDVRRKFILPDQQGLVYIKQDSHSLQLAWLYGATNVSGQGIQLTKDFDNNVFEFEEFTDFEVDEQPEDDLYLVHNRYWSYRQSSDKIRYENGLPWRFRPQSTRPLPSVPTQLWERYY